MGLIVKKFGGTSVGDLDRIRNVANRIVKTYTAGNNVVVILSAMAGITDGLIDMAHKITPSPDKREMDVLLATGEQTSAALLSITLMSMGYPASSLLGHQAGVMTNCAFGDARIVDVGASRIKEYINNRRIVAIAAAIDADSCEIYTDVDGIYTADPNICEKARKMNKVSFDEMLEMASLGAKVLQIRSVELAKKYNVPIHVRSSFNEEEGTMVMDVDSDMESPVVSGVTHNKNEARITIKTVPDQPGIASKIFSAIAEAGILVDMIIQSSPTDNLNDLSFTVPKKDFKEAMKIGKRVGSEIGAKDVLGEDSVAKVSVTGVGMKSHHGVAAKMFTALANENINISMISTSEIRISCVIEEKYAELAVRALHSAFGLDKEE
ncbi:MAG: aspartate kinase [Deltaproteobacteria bacterium]|nr:aspartate kinase [Deltaproteobacteria bacterium]